MKVKLFEQINELKTRLDGLATDVESKIELRMFVFAFYNGSASLREKLKEMKSPSLYVWYTMPEFSYRSQYTLRIEASLSVARILVEGYIKTSYSSIVSGR